MPGIGYSCIPDAESIALRQAIGTACRKERERAGLARSDVQKKGGPSEAVLSRLERGHYYGSPQLFYVLSKLYGGDVAAAVGRSIDGVKKAKQRSE